MITVSYALDGYDYDVLTDLIQYVRQCYPGHYPETAPELDTEPPFDRIELNRIEETISKAALESDAAPIEIEADRHSQIVRLVRYGRYLSPQTDTDVAADHYPFDLDELDGLEATLTGSVSGELEVFGR